MARCVCGCGARGVQKHHVIYEQHVRAEGGDVRDGRNLVPLAVACHAAHHGRQRPLPLHRLPDSVFEFARELLGPAAAFEYLARRYAGGDPRHDALLSG